MYCMREDAAMRGKDRPGVERIPGEVLATPSKHNRLQNEVTVYLTHLAYSLTAFRDHSCKTDHKNYGLFESWGDMLYM